MCVEGSLGHLARLYHLCVSTCMKKDHPGVYRAPHSHRSTTTVSYEPLTVSYAKCWACAVVHSSPCCGGAGGTPPPLMLHGLPGLRRYTTEDCASFLGARVDIWVVARSLPQMEVKYGGLSVRRSYSYCDRAPPSSPFKNESQRRRTPAHSQEGGLALKTCTTLRVLTLELLIYPASLTGTNEPV